jgi:hypothetical protein
MVAGEQDSFLHYRPPLQSSPPAAEATGKIKKGGKDKRGQAGGREYTGFFTELFKPWMRRQRPKGYSTLKRPEQLKINRFSHGA